MARGGAAPYVSDQRVPLHLGAKQPDATTCGPTRGNPPSAHIPAKSTTNFGRRRRSTSVSLVDELGRTGSAWEDPAMISIHTLCIELTARCALRCIHCSANAAPERNEMLDARTLVQRLGEVGTLEEIYLSGGEPFEHAEIAAIVEASRRTARTVVAYSSGVWMGPHGDEALPRAVIRSTAAGVSRVDLSLYAADPDTHDAVTQTPGSFERTLETARRFGEEGIAFGVHHVPVASSGDVVDVAGLATDLGAVRFHVLAVAAQGRARRVAVAEPSAKLLNDLRRLQSRSWPFELVMSAGLRRALGQVEPTPRDMLRTAFLDVRGFLYPGEGERLVSLRGRSSLAQRSLGEMYAEIALPI